MRNVWEIWKKWKVRITSCQAQPQFNVNSSQFNSLEAEIALFPDSKKPPTQPTRSDMELYLNLFRSI